MSMLYAQAEYVNATEGHRYGDEPITETFTDDIGELYRRCAEEYGRCISKVYIDLPDAPATPIGWVFVKRVEYDDYHSRETYLRETWVTVYDGPVKVERTLPHPIDITRKAVTA